MFKAVILLKRKEDLSFDAFRQWWLEDHAPLVRRLPGLKQAVFNLVSEENCQEYDGISELWFESEQNFIDAYASDLGKQVAADSLSKVSKRERLMVTEFQVFPTEN